MSIYGAPYVRYSTDRQNGTSIEVQLDGIRAYCEREGITLIPTIYADIAQSGTNMQRDGMQNLITDAKAGKFQAVIVYDISRGSRDVADWFSFRKLMDTLGVRVLSATERLGSIDDPNAYMTELVTVGLAHHQVLQSRDKSISGKRKRAEKGLFCGGHAPLGYDIADGHYVINANEAPVIKMIFEMYAVGHSYKDILEQVKKTGVCGKQGRPLDNNTLHYILKNEKYTGKFRWFEETNWHMRKWVGHRKNDIPITVEGAIPSIVSEETWELVRRRMVVNKSKGTGNKREDREYLLSGLIRCGECGSPMAGITTISKGREYKNYVCLGKRKAKNCANKNIKGDVLEQYILKQLHTYVLNPATIREMAEKYHAELSKGDTGDLDAMRRRVQAIDVRIKRILDLVEEGTDTPEARKRLVEMSNEKKELNQQIAESKTPEIPPLEDIIYSLTIDAERFASDPSLGREIILRYVHSILVYDLFLDIVYSPNYLNCTKKEAVNLANTGKSTAWLLRYEASMVYTRIRRSEIA